MYENACLLAEVMVKFLYEPAYINRLPETSGCSHPKNVGLDFLLRIDSKFARIACFVAYSKYYASTIP
jgi:hypothetical protein